MKEELLSQKQIQAVEIWNNFDSPEAVAKAIGVNKTTVYSWLKKPLFKSALKSLQKSACEQAMLIIQQGVQAAAESLVDLSHKAESEQVKANAAVNVLKCAKVFIERTENINIDAIDTYVSDLIRFIEQEIDRYVDPDTADKIKDSIESYIEAYQIA